MRRRPLSITAALIAVGLAVTGAAVAAPTAAYAEMTSCAPDVTYTVPDPMYGLTQFTQATWCDSISTDQRLSTIDSQTFHNGTTAPIDFEKTYEQSRKVTTEGGFNATYISAKLGGEDSSRISTTVKGRVPAGGDMTYNVYEMGTVFVGHQYQFPTGDRYCAYHPLSYCSRSNFTTRRVEYLANTVDVFALRLQLQFGMGGACVSGCADPQNDMLVQLTMNVDLAAGTYDARNPWGQSEVGSLSVTAPSRTTRQATVTSGSIRDTTFTVTYNDAGNPVMVTYRYVFRDGTRTESTALTTVTLGG